MLSTLTAIVEERGRQRVHVQASVTCASTGPVFVKDRSRIRGAEGKEVFSEKKAFTFSFQNKAGLTSRAVTCPQTAHAQQDKAT